MSKTTITLTEAETTEIVKAITSTIEMLHNGRQLYDQRLKYPSAIHPVKATRIAIKENERRLAILSNLLAQLE